MTGMTSIDYVTLEVDDPTAAERFYIPAFGLGPQVRLRASEAPSAGFRGFTLSLLVSQPATVDAFVRAALDAGATSLKPAQKRDAGVLGRRGLPDGRLQRESIRVGERLGIAADHEPVRSGAVGRR